MQTMEIPQFVFDKVIDVLVVQVVLAMLVVLYDRCARFRHCRVPWWCRSCSSCTVVDVAVTRSDEFPAVWGVPQTRSSTGCSVQLLRWGDFPHFATFFALRPAGRECPFFQPSMPNNCWLSRARGGGDAGGLTPRCSVAPIRCKHAGVWINTHS